MPPDDLNEEPYRIALSMVVFHMTGPVKLTLNEWVLKVNFSPQEAGNRFQGD